VPVITGADTGDGKPLNVRRTVREYEKAGVAAIHLEDQMWPKDGASCEKIVSRL
jgi:2-methylisocitrate lyase-like PEP mutase family enzyme